MTLFMDKIKLKGDMNYSILVLGYTEESIQALDFITRRIVPSRKIRIAISDAPKPYLIDPNGVIYIGIEEIKGELSGNES